MKSIQEAVASVQNAFPSIYTKDDVIKLLESIEITSAPGFSQETIEKLIDAVTTATTKHISRMDTQDMVDNDSAEFSIGYNNRIELDSVDVDTSAISDEVETAIDDAIKEYFKEGGFFEEDEEDDDIVELERAEETV